MNRKRVTAGAILALAFVLSACAGGPVVSLKNGPKPADPNVVGCLLSYVQGELVNDPTLGPAITSDGHLVAVTWPWNWTGRGNGSEVDILDGSGSVVVKTGTQVYLPGGYNGDSTWLTCTGAHELP